MAKNSNIWDAIFTITTATSQLSWEYVQHPFLLWQLSQSIGADIISLSIAIQRCINHAQLKKML